MSAVIVVRVPKVSDGSSRCLQCQCLIRRGESLEQRGTANAKGVIEYWVNVCLRCVAQMVARRVGK
jgi:hypothetical protein